MRKKQFESIATDYLLPSLPDFCVRGNLICEVPVGNILRAFLFDSSGFSAATFYPQAFVQPLYLPEGQLTLTPGKRFTGPWKFEPGSETQLSRKLIHEIHEVGLPFLRSHRTPEDMVREAKANPGINVNPHVRRRLAYSLLLLGRNDEGLDELDRLLSMVHRMKEAQPWANEIHEEVGTLREKLMRDPREAVATLQKWTEETRDKLNLPL